MNNKASNSYSLINLEINLINLNNFSQLSLNYTNKSMNYLNPRFKSSKNVIKSLEKKNKYSQ